MTQHEFQENAQDAVINIHSREGKSQSETALRKKKSATNQKREDIANYISCNFKAN